MATSSLTKDALQHKIRSGERCGDLRYGYDLAADGKTLVRNVVEQETLGLIRELRAAGKSLRGIAAELDRRGILTKKGNTKWQHTTVQSVLDNQRQRE